jgi:lipoyl-dependent peroxiredoxin
MSGMTRKAKAVWKGTGKEGTGTINAESGVLKDTPYSFSKRFGDEPGTNPEELLAAAHSACFAMALSFGLNKEGFTADELAVDCGVTVAQDGGGFTITKSALTLNARIPGIDEAKFQEIAAGAKANCPVSKLYKCEVTLDAKLASQSKAA